SHPPLSCVSEHNRLENPLPDGIPPLKTRKRTKCDGRENEPSWEVNMRPEVLQSSRDKILNLLNFGTTKELKSLQKIGDKKAKLIVGWRQINGPFKKVEDLEALEGMSVKLVSSFITVNTFDINPCILLSPPDSLLFLILPSIP
ncbi:hypothetical protein FKM82_027754, partial [Ascaphus truei]